MMTKKLLMQLDYRLRDIFGLPHVPFGGLSIIFIGDLSQVNLNEYFAPYVDKKILFLVLVVKFEVVRLISYD